MFVNRWQCISKRYIKVTTFVNVCQRNNLIENIWYAVTYPLSTPSTPKCVLIIFWNALNKKRPSEDDLSVYVLWFYSFQSGWLCQFFTNPMAEVSTMWYFDNKATRRCLNVLLGRIMSTKCFKMQRVKNTRPCCTLLSTQGRNGLVMVNARKESERFHNLAWWQHEFRVSVTMVIHETNTGTVRPKYRAIFLRIWLLAMFSYSRVKVPKGIISAIIHEGGYRSS